MKPEKWDPSKNLDRPLRWRLPRRVRLELDFADREGAAAAYGVMAATPHHVYEVMAKDIGEAVKFFAWFRERANPYDGWGRVPSMTDGDKVMDRWQRLADDPLLYVILGVTVYDQSTADKRILSLLTCPAAVRWVHLQLKSAISLGLHLGIKLLDGAVWSGSLPLLDWVTCAGDCEPVHPGWLRSLRDHCIESDVPFAFMGWGEWAPTPWGVAEYGKQDRMWDGTKFIETADVLPCETRIYIRDNWVRRVGKARAGRLLDGRTWDEYPEVPRGD